MIRRERETVRGVIENPYLREMITQFSDEYTDFRIPVEMFSDAYKGMVATQSPDLPLFIEGLTMALTHVTNPRVSIGAVRVALYSGHDFDAAVHELDQTSNPKGIPELAGEIRRYREVRAARQLDEERGVKTFRLSERVADFIETVDRTDLGKT